MGRQESGYQRVGLVGVWMLWLLQLGLYATFVGEASQALGPDAVVARVQGRYERTTRLQARFRQETRVPGFDQVQTGEGQVWILKPGMMRWDYTKPERQTIIANGDTLWIYLPEDRQVIRPHQPLSGNAHACPLPGRSGSAHRSVHGGGMSIQGPGEGGLLQLELTPKVKLYPILRCISGSIPAPIW
jgi:outer membrane lipoprotein carrier protein